MIGLPFASSGGQTTTGLRLPLLSYTKHRIE
jgi:hypothetical protein